MKRTLTLLLTLALSAALLAGCDSKPAAESTAPDRADDNIEWQYITAEDTKAKLDAGEPLIVLDTRTDDMYSAGHIEGAFHVPCFPVDTPELEEVLREAVPTLQESEDPIAVVCKTGNKGAKRAISLLIEEGVAADRLFILEGGGEGWSYDTVTD